MVKGTNRQVVVVRSPDAKLFEQAIFLLRADAAGTEGLSEQELLQQARKAANSYMTEAVPPRTRRELLCALGGAAATGLVWLLSVLL